MNTPGHISILRRMAGQAGDPAPASPPSTARAIRLALVKAASDTVGLVLDVVSTGAETGGLDPMLAGLDPGLMLIGLRRGDRLAGCLALDMQLRASVLEMQIIGRLWDQPVPDRPATATDRALCDPMLAGFLAALPQALAATSYAGWADDLQPGESIADPRAAGLLLADGDYRALRLHVQLGGADRQGALVLLLPVPQDLPAPPAAAPVADWHRAFPAIVQTAPASLRAVLHRITLPLAQARALQIGQVVALPGCTVSAVRLIAPDGRCVAQGKLGQMGGKRAVRVAAETAARMDDLVVDSGSALPALLPPEVAGA